jgi:hypothetical protein
MSRGLSLIAFARTGAPLGSLQTRRATPTKPRGANGKLDHGLVAIIKRELKTYHPSDVARRFPQVTTCQVYSIYREESYRYVEAAK